MTTDLMFMAGAVLFLAGLVSLVVFRSPDNDSEKESP